MASHSWRLHVQLVTGFQLIGMRHISRPLSGGSLLPYTAGMGAEQTLGQQAFHSRSPPDTAVR